MTLNLVLVVCEKSHIVIVYPLVEMQEDWFLCCKTKKRLFLRFCAQEKFGCKGDVEYMNLKRSLFKFKTVHEFHPVDYFIFIEQELSDGIRQAPYDLAFLFLLKYGMQSLTNFWDSLDIMSYHIIEIALLIFS